MSELDDFIAGIEGRSHSETPSVDTPQVSSENTKKRKKAPKAEVVKKPKVQENRAIYISNLPGDVTKKELEREFSRFGIIDKGINGEPRIKFYTDDEGKFKNEALIVFFKKESIPNAIRIMDGFPLRPGDYDNGDISVKEADFANKKVQDGDQVVSKLSRKDRKESERVRAEQSRLLAEWSDNEEEVAQMYAPKKNKWNKIVIIKNCFTLEEIEDDEDYDDVKKDMTEAAEEFGTVTNTTVYDKEPEGIVTVRFSDFEDAENFVKSTNQGRKYGGRPVHLSIAQDKPRFRKSGKGLEIDSEEEEERLERLVQQ